MDEISTDNIIKGDKPDVRKTDPIAMASGISGVIVFVVGLLMLPLVANADGDAPTDGGEGQPFEYIEARLLKYGEVKDDTKLPDRIVPAMPTAPEETLPLDTNEEKPEPLPREKEPEKQRDAVMDDKLREVFDNARAFAEIQDDYIPEGHPDGVPDGDVTDPALASMGATWGKRVEREIGVRYPTLLTEEILRKLKAKVHIQVSADLRIISFKFKSRSGNPLFDDAIQNAIDRMIVERRPVPDPPEALGPALFGSGMVMTFNGRNGKYE